MYFYRMHKNQTMALNTVDKRIKRLNSVMYSAVYVRKKYGLQDPYILRFFKERISIAFEEIDRLRFYRRFFYLIRMKCHDLIVFGKNDVKGRGSFSEYLKRRLDERKKILIEKTRNGKIDRE